MIGSTFYIKRGDRLPAISTQITDSLDQPINLTGSSVLFVMRGPWDTSPAISSAATIVDAAQGKVRYDWTGTQTDVPGSFRGEFRVTFAGGSQQSFPTNGFIDIEISNDLDAGAAVTPLYCSPNDMLLGDLQIPPSVDPSLYIDRASRDIDIAMGAIYEVPLTSLTGRGALVIKSVSADLASAYLLMAQAQGGEDSVVNAYAMQLYQRAWDRLMPFRQGEPLEGGVLANPPDPSTGASSAAVSILQKDKYSLLDRYEVLVHSDPIYGTPNYDNPYASQYPFYGEDGYR